MMELTLYQIIIFAFVLFLLLRVTLRFIFRRKTLRELIVAYFIWGSLAAITYTPTFLGITSDSSESIFTVIIICIIALFYSTFTNMIKSEKMENSITRIVRRNAIEQYFKDKSE